MDRALHRLELGSTDTHQHGAGSPLSSPLSASAPRSATTTATTGSSSARASSSPFAAAQASVLAGSPTTAYSNGSSASLPHRNKWRRKTGILSSLPLPRRPSRTLCTLVGLVGLLALASYLVLSSRASVPSRSSSATPSRPAFSMPSAPRHSSAPTRHNLQQLRSLAAQKGASTATYAAVVLARSPGEANDVLAALDAQKTKPLSVLVSLPRSASKGLVDSLKRSPLTKSLAATVRQRGKDEDDETAMFAHVLESESAFFSTRDDSKAETLLIVPPGCSSTVCLPPNLANALTTAATTEHYAASVVSSAGLSAERVCLSSPERTTALEAPVGAFLVRSRWLAELVAKGGLPARLSSSRSDKKRETVPLGLAIAHVLAKKGRISSYAVPLDDANAGKTSTADSQCRGVRDALKARPDLAATFLPYDSDELGPDLNASGASNVHQERAIALVVPSADSVVQRSTAALACSLAATHAGARVSIVALGAAPAVDGVCHGVEATRATSPAQIPEALDSVLGPASQCRVILLVEGEGEEHKARDALRAWAHRRTVTLIDQHSRRSPRAAAEDDSEEGARQWSSTEVTLVDVPADDIDDLDWLAALPFEALRHWNSPRIDISVITNNRPTSLSRLLSSLANARYYGDDVVLAVNLEQTTDRETERVVSDFAWPHGTLASRHRIVLGGLMPAIVESWYPANNDSYGVFLEDDVEVSPLFYGWLKFAILYHRYHPPARRRASHLFGISLYQQKNIELRLEGRRPFDAHKMLAALGLDTTLPYLSQVPCSWGAAYFPEVWREFHSYLALRLSEVAMPISDVVVPDIRSNRWPRSWKRYFIELVYLRGYAMLYPNYPDFFSFSTNHLEKGEHIHMSEVDLKRKMQFEVPLMPLGSSLLDLPQRALPPWHAMPLFDLWGSLASDDELMARGWHAAAELDVCASLFRLDVPPSHDAHELLCPREYTRLDDFIDVTPASDGQAGPAAVPEQLPQRPVVKLRP